MDLGDQFSISEFRGDDKRQFNIVYVAYENPVYLFVYDHVKNRADAQDITSIVMAKLWRGRSKMESADHIGNFLFQVAFRECIDRLRRRRAEQKRVTFVSDQLENIAEDGGGFSGRYEILRAEVVQQDFLRTLREELARMPKRCREIYVMRYLELKEVKEIAVLLQISEKTVYAQLSIAKVRLIKVFSDKGMNKALGLIFILMPVFSILRLFA